MGFVLIAQGQNTKQEKRIYLVDVTASMVGEGSVETLSIFDVVKDDLANTIESLNEPSTEIVIIPFTDASLDVVKASIKDKKLLLDYIKDLSIKPGNTNITAAWSRGVEEVDSTRINYFFLLTDGLHNCGTSKDALYSELKQWGELAKGKYYYAFYVVVDNDVRKQDLCNVANQTDQLWVVESMDVQEIAKYVNLDEFDKGEELEEEELIDCIIDDEGNSHKISWRIILWIFIAAILLALIYYIVRRSFFGGSTTLGNIGEVNAAALNTSKIQVPTENLTANEIKNECEKYSEDYFGDDDKCKIEEAYEWNISKLSDIYMNENSSIPDRVNALREMRRIMDAFGADERELKLSHLPQKVNDGICELGKAYCLPQKEGSWTGEPGNSSWIPNDDAIPKNKYYNNVEGKTWRQIKQENGIDGIQFKDGVPDFSNIAKEKVEIDFPANGRYVKDGEKGVHELAFAKMAEKRGWTIEDARAYKEKENLVWHEDADCKTVLLIPREIHDNIPHIGGIALAKIV